MFNGFVKPTPERSSDGVSAATAFLPVGSFGGYPLGNPTILSGFVSLPASTWTYVSVPSTETWVVTWLQSYDGNVGIRVGGTTGQPGFKVASYDGLKSNEHVCISPGHDLAIFNGSGSPVDAAYVGYKIDSNTPRSVGGSGLITSGSTTTLYTVPAGKVLVVLSQLAVYGITFRIGNGSNDFGLPKTSGNPCVARAGYTLKVYNSGGDSTYSWYGLLLDEHPSLGTGTVVGDGTASVGIRPPVGEKWLVFNVFAETSSEGMTLAMSNGSSVTPQTTTLYYTNAGSYNIYRVVDSMGIMLDNNTVLIPANGVRVLYNYVKL